MTIHVHLNINSDFDQLAVTENLHKIDYNHAFKKNLLKLLFTSSISLQEMSGTRTPPQRIRSSGCVDYLSLEKYPQKRQQDLTVHAFVVPMKKEKSYRWSILRRLIDYICSIV